MIRLQTFLSLAALLCLPRFAAAQDADFPAAPPPDAPASVVKPAIIARETLSNGLRVVIQENHRVPTVHFKMGIRAGQVSDPIDMPLMAQMAIDVIEQGSAKYDPEKREVAANAMGGSLGIAMELDYVNVSASCLSNYSEKMLALMADMIRQPKLDPDVIDYFSQVMQERVKRHQYPRSEDESKGRSAYARRFPTAETVKNMDRDHLIEFLNNYYSANNSILTICGDVDAKATMKQVKAVYGDWKRGETPPLPKFVKEPIEPFYYIYLEDNPKAVESSIVMFVNVPGLNDNDRTALQMANVIVGETLDSRLFRTIREKYGYVYTIHSGVIFSQYATQFQVQTMCRTAVTAKTVKQVEIEVAKMGDGPPSEEEMQEAKNTLTHKYDLALQSQAASLEQLFETEFYNRPSDYFQRLRGKINAMTAAEVLRAAKKYLFPNGSAQIQITGPKEKIVDRLMNAKVGEIVNPDAD